MKPQIAFALLLVAVTTACETRTYEGGVRVPNEAPVRQERFDKTFHLTRIEIDREAVRAGADLLFTEPPPHREFGLERRAQGILSISDRGFVQASVRVAEPVVAVSGQRTEQAYTLLSFFGKFSGDGKQATFTDGEPIDTASVQRPDAVKVLEKAVDRIVIQPVYQGRSSAYRYHFYRRGLTNPNVPFPWK